MHPVVILIPVAALIFGPRLWVRHVLKQHNRKQEELPGTAGYDCRQPEAKVKLLLALGGNDASEAAVERGLPFLLYRLRLRGDSFVEEPILVRGRDTSSGLWIVDPEDLEDVDALPPDAPLNGNVLLPIFTLTASTGKPSVSANTIAQTVRVPVPRSWVPQYDSTPPSGWILKRQSESFAAPPQV